MLFFFAKTEQIFTRSNFQKLICSPEEVMWGKEGKDRTGDFFYKNQVVLLDEIGKTQSPRIQKSRDFLRP